MSRTRKAEAAAWEKWYAKHPRPPQFVPPIGWGCSSSLEKVDVGSMFNGLEQHLSDLLSWIRYLPVGTKVDMEIRCTTRPPKET